jgi:diguanylate cyclase (GGDEF)-like protein
VVANAGLLIFGRVAAGEPPDRVEAYGMVSLLVLALIRQMLTVAENTRLLAKVQEWESQLHHQAFHDSLTGLANRALFTGRLRRAVEVTSRVDGASVDQPGVVSVVFVDLDYVNRVNDRFGHAAGDDLLRICAARLQAATRATDTVARPGGDEFAVILDHTGAKDPRRVAERLAAAVQEPCRPAGRAYTRRASLGLVTLDRAQGPASPDELLHEADLAMYAAKRERSGRLVVYRPGLAIHHDLEPGCDHRGSGDDAVGGCPSDWAHPPTDLPLA